MHNSKFEPPSFRRTENLPLFWIKSDIRRREGVAENVVLISVRDGDEVNTAFILVDDVEIATEPVDS